jgi:hypothetical protein
MIFYGILIVTVLIFIWKYQWHTICGSQYRVLRRGDSLRAAQILHTIDQNNHTLIRFIMNKYPARSAEYNLANRIRLRYKSSALRENDPPNIDSTSYTQDKGTILALCLRTSDQFVDMNLLRFVDIHELAHIGTKSWGHESDFWSNFKFLLNEATLAGLYHPQNFAEKKVTYCGLEVAHNPLFDDSIPSQAS